MTFIIADGRKYFVVDRKTAEADAHKQIEHKIFRFMITIFTYFGKSLRHVLYSPFVFVCNVKMP